MPSSFRQAEDVPSGFGPPGPTSYTQTKGTVFDSQPRVISNLIVDQTAGNPAAVEAAGQNPELTPSGAFVMPNVAPDTGLSAPYNSWFTLFGQFFDHGLDLTNKSGGTVFMPLKPDDPLYNPASPTNFMVLTRSTNQPGPDGVVGDNPATPADESADDVKNATNQTSPFVDQSQTYTSHPSHQVFLRQYANNGAGKPVATGELLTAADGGMATWAAVKAQAKTLLGINLADADVLNLPLLATDPYGRFTRGANGYPQMATTGGLVEGDPAANGGSGVLVPATVIKTGHAFLDDIAHNAAPKPGKTPDTDTDVNGPAPRPAGTYDDELLNTQERRPLLDAFLNPPAFTENGTLTPEQAAGGIVRGMTEQRGNEIDEFVTEALRNRLLGLPLDLASLNLARGREAGVPPLNAVRRQFFAATQGNAALAPYANWNDFGLAIKHPSSLINFVAAYGTHSTVVDAPNMAAKRDAAGLLVSNGPGAPAVSVAFMEGTGAWADSGGITTTGLDTVDLWVGGLAEKQQPFGGLLGNTFNYVFETQMERLQDGDRFYYLARTAGLNMLVQLEGNSFSELIMRNTDVANLPADAFSRLDYHFYLDAQNATGAIVDDPNTPYNEVALLIRTADNTIRFNGAEHVAFHGTAGGDKVWSSEGDDTLRGNDGNDRLEGGAGNDSIISGLGDDVLTDSFGDDVTKGGDGNDAISSGQGFDLNQAGRGNDFVISGSDPTETFGAAGNDFIFGGDSADIVFGDDDDDWIEGGGQADLLQGDNGAPFADDPNQPGHDVIDGDGGNDDYDSEGGDDIMVAGPGTDRHEGMLGFDWVTHESDPQAANSDLNFTGLLPPSVDTLRDRFDNVEGLSGWSFDDVLRGDDFGAADLVGHELNAAGIARVTNLNTLLPAGATSFNGGNIITGGGGSDIMEGRGGNDIIHGDKYVNVRLSVRSASDPNVEIQSAESMAEVRAAVFAGTINPGQLRIVREILPTAPGPNDVDTAVFSDVRASYTVTVNPDSSVTVAHTLGTTTDGTDRLVGVERLAFSDQTVEIVNQPNNGVPTGTVIISDTSPTENQQLTATRAFDDPDQVVDSTILYTWQVESSPDQWTSVATGTTFTPTDPGIAVGRSLRVVATFQDGDGLNESVMSDPTAVVTNVNNAPTGAPTLSDTTPSQGTAIVSATDTIADADGLGVNFARQWQERTGTAAFTNIAGATGVNFTPTATQVGKELRVSVSFTDNHGTSEQLFSAPTAAVVVPPDSTPPTVTSRTPGFNATGVNVANNISATFNEGVNGISASTVKLTRVSTGVDVAATLTPGAATTFVRTVTLNPDVNLAAGAQYTATLTSGIVNRAGLAFAGSSWTFTTASATTDTTPPTVTARTPAVNATGVAVSTNVTATFSESVKGISATTAKLTNVSTGAVIAATLTPSSATTEVGSLTLNPNADLAAGVQYRVDLTSGITDLANNPLAATSWTFTTAASGGDTVAPTVTSRSPVANATGVSRTANITATFSEQVTGISSTTVKLTRVSDGSVIAGALTPSSAGTATGTVTLIPGVTLAANVKYKVTLTGGIKDLARNPLARTSWTFTTGP